ncbi:BA75_01695T0 [Komagataella pastoris]|uniref:BA75_01695T0 n=1 Tax=Komagataella pastoris TaxID=4922 RepID=A0A1B2J933_PICPA|nr:BA75_01695T0 [Komagataella pastoris]
MAYFTLPEEYLPDLQDAVNFFISFAPFLSYGSTIYGITQSQSSTGFSLDICATMLLSASLRVMYYFNEKYEFTLLRQCIVMIVIQTLLLRTALKYRSNTYSCDNLVQMPNYNLIFVHKMQELVAQLSESLINDSEGIPEHLDLIWKAWVSSWRLFFVLIIYGNFANLFLLFDVSYARPLKFWQWEQQATYWKFLGGFWATIVSLELLLYKNEQYGNTIGALSLLIESLLPLPQILMFYRVKSVRNFKSILLLSWLGGDMTKISYLVFGTNQVSAFFIIAAVFQMSLNIVITCQFIHYKRIEYEYFSSHTLDGLDEVEFPIEMEMRLARTRSMTSSSSSHGADVRTRSGTVV